ncbi:MAG: hypothetical protein JNG86_00785, partial [Verrucomicrobiaceae bacterium]|nr:hypothetical protein [Verrucomicrobiaceae bacterium]
LTISNNSIVSSTSTATSKAPGIRVIAFGGADITRATINANTVTNFPSDAGIMVQGGNAVEGGDSSNLGTPGSGTDIIAITNNIISGASAVNRIGTQGILTTINGTGQGNFNITGNSVSHTAGNSISHNAFGDAIVTSTISNNTVISNNSLGAQGIAGGTSFTGGFLTNTPSLRVTISGNNVSQTDGNGILFVARDLSTGVLAAKIVNNTVAAPLAGVRPGIRVDAGNASGDNAAFLEISGNTSAGSGGSQGIGLRKQGTVTATNRFAVRGMTATATPGIETFINGQNPAGGGTLLISATSGFSEWTGTGGQPAFLALLFAENLPETGFEHSTVEMLPVDRIVPVPEKAAKADLTAQIAPKAVSPAETLTQATLEKLAAEAIARWEASGLTPAQSAKLHSLRFELADLGALHLGQSRGDLIQISRKAGGSDWFIDQTPSDDVEFSAISNFKSQVSNPAAGGVDLLTTLMHEMGHALGLEDRYDLRSRRSLMFGHLTRGERRLPAKGEAAAAVPFHDDTSRFLGATINIGTLPAGKSVTIVGTVLVNNPANTQLISSQGTVSGGNFTSVLTDDPAFAGTTDITTTPVERPDAAVVSLNRVLPNPTKLSPVTWQIVFDQPVSGLVAANFALVNSGLTAPSITGVTASGAQPTTTWNISASTGTGSGTLGLNLDNHNGALSHDITNQPFTGQVYAIDKLPPVFTSLVRQTPTA